MNLAEESVAASQRGWQRPGARLSTRITAYSLLALVLVTVPGWWLLRNEMERRIERQRLEEHLAEVAEEASLTTRRLREAEASIVRFASVLSAEPVAPRDEDPARFGRWVQQDSDGAWRSQREHFSGEQDAGIWLPRGFPLDDETRAFLLRARQLTELYGMGARSAFPNTWVLPRQGGAVIYWPSSPGWVYDAEANLDYTSTEWIQLTRPADNPTGRPRWTPPVFDPASGTWVISVVAPFEREGAWAGAVGHDLPLDVLHDQIRAGLIFPGTEYSVVRQDRRMLLSSAHGEMIRASGGRFSLVDADDADLSGIFDRWLEGGGLRPVSALSQDGRSWVTASPLFASGWVVLHRVSRASIHEDIRSGYEFIWAGFALILLTLMVVLRVLITRQVVPTVQVLEEGTQRIARGELDHHFDLGRAGEFIRISNALNHMIWEVRASHEALRDSEERLRRTIRDMPVMMVALGPAGELEVWNRECERVTGFGAREIMRHPWAFDLLLPDAENRASFLEAWLRSREDFVDREWELLCKDGSRRVVAWSNVSHRFPVPGWASWGIGVDITKRKQAEAERLELEAQVQHGQKLESLGLLAGGVAHDFNNLLMGILGSADLARHRLAEDSPAVADLDRVIAASRRLADLTNQLLAYSGRGRFVVGQHELTQLVHEMAELLQTVISKKVRLVFEVNDQHSVVEGDATQLRQVVMNLITNASDALGDAGGEVRVRTGCLSLTAADLAVLGLPDTVGSGGLWASLEVSDTGCGMDPATRERIFEPFFTTKAAGRGLGLAAVQGIVRSHGGVVIVDSAPGEGTTFRILLPCSSQVVSEQAEPAAASVRPLGEQAVFVVDDEEVVREVAREMLQALGYRVYEARDGVEAIEFFRDHHHEVDVVLLDMTMPRMDGEETYHALREMKPAVRVVLSSGFEEQDAGAALPNLSGFIQKPYTLAGLGACLRAALVHAPGSS